MDVLLWLMVLYFVGGPLIYLSTVKNVKRKIAFIKADTGSQESSKHTTFAVWWIVGITIWGVVGIFLIVSWFLNNAG